MDPGYMNNHVDQNRILSTVVDAELHMQSNYRWYTSIDLVSVLVFILIYLVLLPPCVCVIRVINKT